MKGAEKYIRNGGDCSLAFFNAGDVVTVRPDIKYSSYYMEGGSVCDSAVDAMIELAGESVTIRGMAGGKYRIYENDWNWTDEMFIEFLERDYYKELPIPPEDELMQLF